MFSGQILSFLTRVVGNRSTTRRTERGAAIVEYGFLVLMAVTATMFVADAIGVELVDLWESNNERFATAVQPAFETGFSTDRPLGQTGFPSESPLGPGR